MGVKWSETSSKEDLLLKELIENLAAATARTGTRADLIFGSNSQLRALAEVYATDDSI